MRTAIPLLILCITAAWSHTNLLPNGSFENDRDGDGVADSWRGEVHTHEGARGSFSLDPDAARTGNAAQRIDNAANTGAWVRVGYEPIAASPNTAYRVSFWVRSEGSYTAILYEFQAGGRPYITTTLASGKSTDGWVQHTKTVVTSEHATHFKLSLITNGLGSVWFDDASVIRIAERPMLKAPQVDTAPAIDGRPDEPVWETAALAKNFMVLGAEGELAPVQTAARVMHDSDALYIAFECDEPSTGTLLRGEAGESARVWAQDVVEVFIDLDGDRQGYLHLGISAGGGWWQERRLGGRWYTDWFSWADGDAPTPRWSAAASVGEGRWTAELALPFEGVGGMPRSGKVWGLQFCRTRRAGGGEEHSTWSYTEGTRFAVPQRFGALILRGHPQQEPLPIARKVNADQFVPTVVPEPAQATWLEGALRISPRPVIRIETDDQRPEAQWLADDLQARFGLEPVIALNTDLEGTIIDIGAPVGADTPDHPEGYRLDVTGDSVRLTARTPRGRLYGVATIRQMLAEDEAGVFLRCATIIDQPSLEWRGWHMAAPPASDIGEYRRLVDTLALLKYNTIVWEVNDRLQYESHPDITAANSPTKQELAELVEYARSRHFEVIPQLATFAHFGYALGKPAYRHLSESEQTTYGHRSRFNYCPSNPATYDLVFDLMAEVTEVFQPRYFHIGHDEASFDDIGVCERCTGTEPWVLWAQDIRKLDAWIREHGMRTILWGDQFLPEHNGGEPFYTARATDMIPKDILVFDWHYSPNHNYDATISYFKEHGFEVVGCPWYEPVNVYRFASAAKRNEILGFCGTTWSGVAGTLRAMPHLPAAWVIGGENCWTPDVPPIGGLGYDPVPVFNGLHRPEENRLPLGFRALDLSGHFNETIVDTERREGWMGEGPRYDLRTLPTGIIWAGDIPFIIPESAGRCEPACVMLASRTTPEGAYPTAVYEIPVGFATRSLYFLHTCQVPPNRNRQLYATENPGTIGSYVINYQDGEQAEMRLVYQANIHDWNGQRGPAQALGLWTGNTAGGALISLPAVQWLNPRPDVPVRSIDFISALGDVRPVLLAITAAH